VYVDSLLALSFLNFFFLAPPFCDNSCRWQGMDALRDLGFTADEALAGMKHCGGNIDEAANFLFSLTEFERQALVTRTKVSTAAPASMMARTLPSTDAEDGPVKMVLCVRRDLDMTCGKQCAQCCHAAVALCDAIVMGKMLWWKQQWNTQNGSAKIVLGVDSEEQLLRIAEHAAALNLPFHVVQDAGRTQVAQGSRTVVGIGPAPSSLIDKVTGQLSLL
jgi:peptidyl-tRNA hydrolase, PTH2 family